ncbi:CTP synthase 1, partial [Fragariocoptes setiger]
MKYILVTGGTMSGIGKGVVTSSIGAILKACNIATTVIKIDPYLNIDAGTFSPYEHGEVYVLSDGLEVDLDFGTYERFLDVKLRGDNNITTGKINKLVWKRERQGDFLGKTVQTIPHMTDTIQEWIERVALLPCDDNETQPTICLIELGGTIGDIESMAHVAALARFRNKLQIQDFCVMHVGVVPTPRGEHKTKPIQKSVGELRGLGLYPDMIFCRTDTPITQEIRQKISDYCGVNVIIDVPDLPTIYAVPNQLVRQGAIRAIGQVLNIQIEPGELISKWIRLSEVAVGSIGSPEELRIALVGKYTSSLECYTSVNEAVNHAAHSSLLRPKLIYVDAASLEGSVEGDSWHKLRSCHGLIVPGGFGERGIKGKILALEWARTNKVPCLGICLGFQCAVIEFAKNVLDMSADVATSSEFMNSINDNALVIEMLEYQDPERKLGGTMRRGLRTTKFAHRDCELYRLYKEAQKLYEGDVVKERHRHRYEINTRYKSAIEDRGMRFVGTNDDGTRMEIMELSEHPYYVGTQYHPEYQSRPFCPSPLFIGLIRHAMVRRESQR